MEINKKQNMNSKCIKMPFFLKEKIRQCSSLYAKTLSLDDAIRNYFIENNIYDEIKDDYINLVVNQTLPEVFIEKFTREYEKKQDK